MRASIEQPALGAERSVLGVRATRLFVMLAAFLAGNALIAEFVGVKIFALEPTLGMSTLDWRLFGQSGSLSFTSGVLFWPFDVAVFNRIRRATGERWIWLRATGSTAVSQLIDSFVVLYIAFVLGPQHWPTSLFLAVGTVNYAYKLLMAFLLIPLIYLTRRGIVAYLGREQASELRTAASQLA